MYFLFSLGVVNYLQVTNNPQIILLAVAGNFVIMCICFLPLLPQIIKLSQQFILETIKVIGKEISIFASPIGSG